jgi:PilX N-terminal
MKKHHRPGPGPQRGAAALIVVLLLFFIVSLVSAYAGRSLIFEQRTSTNQYRATQAFEAAEAGLEWAVAMLNGGRVTADCIPPAPIDVTQPSFRQRYIAIDDASGNVTPVPWVDGITAERPSCVSNGAGWNCSCPTGAAPAPAIPAGGGVHAGFRICFEAVDPPQPGVVRLVSTGRTSFVDRPCEERGEGTAGEAAATVSVVVALSSGLAAPPGMALTVRGDLDVVSPMRLLPFAIPSPQELDAAWMPNGWLVRVGGAANNLPNLQPNNVRGTPIEALVATDPKLGSLTPDQAFASVFKMSKAAYRNQPATVVLNDCAVACRDKLLAAWQPNPELMQAGRINPGRIIWVEGDMAVEADLNLGTVEAPVLIVATGNVRLAASVNIVGLLYSQAADWDNGGPGDAKVRGAAVAEGNFIGRDIGGGDYWVQYDSTILRWLRLGTGSFVRVPGSWRDFP